MEYRSQEIKAGLMIIVSVIILFSFLIAISGLDWFNSTKKYFARFQYISGLEVGSVVRFGGMEVGKIKEMYVCKEDNSKIEFTLEVDANVPIKTNSEATITSIGIMGEYHINITTGSADSALLASGNFIKCKDVPPLMQLMEPIGEITERINETLVEIKTIFGEQNQAEIHSIFLNLNKLLAQNQRAITMMLQNMNEAIVTLNQFTQKVDGLLVANESEISSSMKHLEETLQQSKTLLKNLDRMMLDFDQVILTRGDHFLEIMENLRRTTDHLEEFSRSIKERPWQLVRKSAPKDRKIE